MTRILSLLTAVLLAAPAIGQVPEMKSADAKKIGKSVGAWVNADHENDAKGRLEGRDDVQKAVDGLAKKYPGAEIYRYLDAWGNALAERGGKYPKAKAGKLAEDDTPFGSTLAYWVPGDYKPKDGGAPLVLWFRDGALDEDTLAAIPAEIQASHAVVAVQVPSAEGEELLSGVRRNFFIGLAWLSRTLRIDRNRVYVVADSAHAGIAAQLCALSPHMVAGCAVAGDPGELPEGNTALFSMNQVDSVDDAWAWLADAPARNPYPTEFDVELTERQFGRIFWVQATNFDPTLEGKPAKLSVKADRDANRIEIEAENVYQVDLYLNDQIVDLSKPITIVRNGQELEVTTTAGFMTLFQNYQVMLLDTGSIFPAKYSGIDIPAKE